MQMSDQEIIRSYDKAAKKREQVRILAELNACPKETIREILRAAGREVPATGNRFTAAKKKAAANPKPKAKLTERAKKAAGLIKNEESKPEERELKTERTEAEEDLGINIDAATYWTGMDDYDSDTMLFAEDEMKKAKEQIAAMEQDIRKWKLEISTLKCKVKYLNLWLMQRGWRDEG